MDGYVQNLLSYRIVHTSPYYISFPNISALHPGIQPLLEKLSELFNQNQAIITFQLHWLPVRLSPPILPHNEFDYKHLNKSLKSLCEAFDE